MRLKDVIAFVDQIKPNSFSNNVKTAWLNEVEGMVQTDIYLLSEADCVPYLYDSQTSLVGATFPTAASIKLTMRPDIRLYGTITLSGLTTYAANNSDQARPIKGISADGLTLYFAPGTFSATGKEAEVEAEAKLTFSGAAAELLVPAPHDKLYRSYLTAMIDFANGEYNKYANTMTMFNAHYAEYMRWFADNFQPADMQAVQRGEEIVGGRK